MFKKLAAFVTAFTLLGSLFFIGSPLAFALSPTDTIIIEGHGWGHGIGMSQWGAIRQAEAGKLYREILNSYYTGITYGSCDSSSPVRVKLATSQPSVKITSSLDFKVELNGIVYSKYNPAGGIYPTANSVWEVKVESGSYRLYIDGVKAGLYGSPIKFISNGDLLRVVNFKPTDPTSAPRYRGAIIAEKPAPTSEIPAPVTLNIVNELSLGEYLYGVVPKEIGGTTSIEAQKAQAVAARTYAVRYGLNKLIASTACQVYGGYECETTQARSAVDATAGVIMLYNGSPIGAFYHSSSGGYTEDVSNVWCSTQANYPYLKGVPDPYCGGDTPNYSWTTTYTVQQLEDRLHLQKDSLGDPWLLGDLLGLEIKETGVSGRVISLAVVGTEGTKIISNADRVRSVLGLKSSLFTLSRVPRLAGSNRYSTSCAISTKGWVTSNMVVLARGDNFPDALAGAALAHKNSCPILLTESATLTGETEAEIKRLGATVAKILGGTGAISSTVENQLKNIMGPNNVDRIGGADRYETAVNIAKNLGVLGTEAIIATGENFADALAISSYSAANQKSILLVKKDFLPKATEDALSDLNISSVIIVGGTGAVSQAVEDALKEKDITVSARIAGADRYDTAYKIVDKYFTAPVNVYISRGDNFPDALSAAPLASKNSSPLLLVKPDELPLGIKSYLEAKRTSINGPYIIGGSGAVSSAVDNAVADTLGI